MKITFIHWITGHIKRIYNSIAFLPAIIVVLFLVLSAVMILFDYSETGKELKASLEWLRLKDASTARSIISVIAGGLISLTVFSFSMVMIVLNQAASQMSNRVLDKLIGNRFQQLILGFYIGTIVYSLFLLAAIRDIDDGIYVPALSTYTLIIFAVIDIFLFIYFLHYITQSIKYQVIIKRIFNQTKQSLLHTCRLQCQPEISEGSKGQPLFASSSGIFEGFEKDDLLNLAVENDVVITFIHPIGTFILQDNPVLNIATGKEKVDDDLLKKISRLIIIRKEQSIDNNFLYGFNQLVEIAIKALSPSINDPVTAIESLRSITRLLSLRLLNFPDNTVRDEQGVPRIITNEKSFEEIFHNAYYPIWDYGKNDRQIQNEMIHLLNQLQQQVQLPVISFLLVKVERFVEEHRKNFA